MSHPNMGNISNALNILYAFIKKAVEVDPWVEESISEPLSEVKEIKKDPALVGFREPVDMAGLAKILTQDEIDFRDDYSENLALLRIALYNIRSILEYSIITDNKEFYEKVGRSLHSNATKFWRICVGIDAEIVDPIVVLENRAEIDGSVIKLSKAYELSRTLLAKSIEILSKLGFNVKQYRSSNYRVEEIEFFNKYLTQAKNNLNKTKPFDSLNKIKEWQLRLDPKKRGGDEKHEIVFSTNYKDIYGMSSRSDWVSCQSIFKGYPKFNSLSRGIIGSCVSKGIGIIYATSGEIYKERGERMIYRSVVWLIKNKKTGNNALFVQDMYPRFEPRIGKLFCEMLEKNLGLEAIMANVSTEEDRSEFYREISEEEVWHQSPYEDTKISRRYSPAAMFEGFKKFYSNVARVIFNIDTKHNIDSIHMDCKKAIFDAIIEMKNDSIFDAIVQSVMDEDGEFRAKDILEEIIRKLDSDSKYRNIMIESFKTRIASTYGNKLDNEINKMNVRRCFSQIF